MSEMVTIVEILDDSPCEIITLADVQDDNKQDLTQTRINILFAKFNECCKHADESKEMVRVLNTVVIPAYKQLDENYKRSRSFEKVLSRTLQVLQTDPSHKFTQIRDLYETMKLHKVRKKVNIVTLEKGVTDINTKRKTDNNDNIVKKHKVDIVVLDDDSSQGIDIENNECDVILLDDGKFSDEEKENNLDKEVSNLHDIENGNSSPLKYTMVSDLVKNQVNDRQPNGSLVDEENSFLVPRCAEPYIEDSKHRDSEQILRIEEEIAMYKEKIAYLEEQEVNYDNLSSPYIISEKYKAKIVELYEELCTLTGTDSVKRCEVRLRVNDGHPAGPVRRLERFLNEGIGSDGEPRFPDFNDVIKCVIISNEQDALGWSKAQIMKEATSLFTQCGRALQKRRQEREWRYLMCRVKEEQFDNDPAENDPLLEARLQENRRIAEKKEADILERFTMMQNLQPKPCDVNNRVNGEIQNGDSEVISDSTDSEKQSSTLIIKETVEVISDEIEYCASNDDVAIVKREPVDYVIEMLEKLDENCTTTVIEIEDPSLVIEVSSDSSDEE